MSIKPIRLDAHCREEALDHIRFNGFAVLKDVVSMEECDQYIEAAYIAKDRIHSAMGRERIDMASADGYCELRLSLAFHDLLLEMLCRQELIDFVDACITPTATLRFQNLEIIAPHNENDPLLRQLTFHQNTTRLHPGHVDAIDLLYAFTDTELVVVPASHQRADTPSPDLLEQLIVTVPVAAGDMLVMDSTLWHRENTNNPNHTRITMGLQFTRSYFKPHFDYPRVLGEEKILALPERVRAMLGWHTRVPASLDEFYRPANQRLYLSGQD